MNAITKFDLTARQVALVKDTVAKECNNDEFNLFMEVARAKGLDPFLGQIIPMVFSKDNAAKRKLTIIISRDGQRVIAQRCGDYRPASKPPEYERDKDLISPLNPQGIVSATVYLWKQDQKSGEWYEVAGQAFWEEFAPVSEQQAVEVKALEWTKTALHDPYGLIIRVAQTRFGAYRILKGSQDRFSVNFGSVPFSGAMDNLDEALTWAQADYEQRIRSALVDVPAIEPVGDDLIGYVLRYGGMCRDCADMDGVCQSGQPCDTDQRRAVVKHTVAALAYGIKHGFIANPFASPPLSREGEDSAEVIEEGAKILAKWISYAWDGLSERDISDEYPDWSRNGIGSLGMQGGKPALRKVAAAILALAATRSGSATTAKGGSDA